MLAMNDILGELTTREIALLFWLAIVAAWVVAYRPAREFLGPLARILVHPKIAGSILALVAYTGLAVLGSYKLGLWQLWMLKDTIFWIFGTGLVVFLDIPKAGEESGFFKKVALDSVRLIVVLEFILNLYTFNLLIESLLLPIITFLVAMVTIAGTKSEFRPAKKLLSTVVSVIGFSFLIYALVNILTSFRDFATIKHVEDFMVPIALTMVVVPFYYVLALYATYESLFTRLDFTLRDKGLGRFAKMRVLGACRFRLVNVRRFMKEGAFDVGAADSRAEIVSRVSQFRRSARC